MKTLKCKTNEGGFVDVDSSEVTFRPQIYAVIVNERKEVLLCPNWDGYDFPGGGIDIGEENEIALEREVFEETGLVIKSGEVFYVKSGLYYHPVKKKGFHTILMYSTATVLGGEITDKNFDSHELSYAGRAVWVPYEQIAGLKFYNSVDSVALIDKIIK